ncbi:MAG TPA: hypothetical protein PLH56_01005 [Candidatus Omnitrophota bacterium]|nr:hypothetical protein [Candidatus Omnitrophota bacterium]
MHKKIFIYFVFFLFGVVFFAFAQETVMEGESLSFKESEKVVERPQKSYFLEDAEVFKKKVYELLVSQKEVSNEIEKRYDENTDGKLQEKELKAFWFDIVFVVERRSWVNVNSEFIRIFDLDKDGRINLQESFEIKKFLR